jgi:hypothetical protein
MWLLMIIMMVSLGMLVLNPSTSIAEKSNKVDKEFEILTLSAKPELVNGGDVLIRINVPKTVPLHQVEVELNGTDVSDSFRSFSNEGKKKNRSRFLMGLLDGLQFGLNTLAVRANGQGKGRPSAEIEIVNYSITGPIFSGEHEEPFICQTEQFAIGNGEMLGPPIDEDCSVERRIDYVYRSTDDIFKPLANPFSDTLPDDLLYTTTTEGKFVPYIVRIETGTINRAIYQTAILDNPKNPGPDLWSFDPSWNGRLVYKFGGGCRTGWYVQGDSTGGVLDDMMLSQGFATASASLNVFGNNCNDLLTAETMMMVKERFIESYGVQRYTIGWGCSGGSYQTNQIGDNYPGLLDGIVPQCSFPDVGFGTIHTLADSRLLENYYENNAEVGLGWTEENLRSVSGYGVFNSIPNLSNGAARIDPVPDRPDGRLSAEFKSVVPDAIRYDPVTNLTGARATVYDHTANVYGKDPITGFALRPLDNVGIQYGLQALNSGQITKEQFLDLNEKIGGFDIDANFISERTLANLDATRRAYETGRMLNGGGGLKSMPILDYDLLYTDLEAGGDIHMKFQHFSTRERLIKANGHADNQVMWSGGLTFFEFFLGSPRLPFILREALAKIDHWLANIESDKSDDPMVVKVLRGKPTDLVDGCWTKDDIPGFIPEPQFFGGVGTSVCNDIYPAFPFPRMVAGGPLANDIVKCQLKEINYSDYEVEFTDDEKARLDSIFPAGVCDWSIPGVEQRNLKGTWLSFGPSPVNLYEVD